MKTINISKFNAEQEAQRIFNEPVSFTDNLEIIDALIKLYPNQIEFRDISSGRVLNYNLAKDIRYNSGLDIR
jgi:hypothetical protein